VAQPRAIFVAALQDPPSVMLAASEDAGIDAGKLLKAALTAAGGRGGGTPRMAQGSVPDASKLDAILAQLSAL
jgi:alanyl-tRNA synthetase